MKNTFVFSVVVGLCVCVLAFDVALGGTNHASRRNAGPAGMLRGKVLMIRIYATDSTSEWPAAEVEAVDKQYKECVDFILSEAKRYNVTNLTFVEEVMNYKANFEIPTSMSDAKWRGTVMMEAAGAAMPKDADKSPAGICAFYKKKYQADGLAVFIHVNKGAKSYTKCAYSGVPMRGFAECGILYRKYNGKQTTLTATYAHEVLHLFGAAELYFPNDRTADRKNIARGMFHGEIMLTVNKNIMAQNISVYTAYRIGWLDELKKEHEVFQDPG